jgi:hypothetical protein
LLPISAEWVGDSVLSSAMAIGGSSAVACYPHRPSATAELLTRANDAYRYY